MIINRITADGRDAHPISKPLAEDEHVVLANLMIDDLAAQPPQTLHSEEDRPNTQIDHFMITGRQTKPRGRFRFLELLTKQT